MYYKVRIKKKGEGRNPHHTFIKRAGKGRGHEKLSRKDGSTISSFILNKRNVERDSLVERVSYEDKKCTFISLEGAVVNELDPIRESNREEYERTCWQEESKRSRKRKTRKKRVRRLQRRRREADVFIPWRNM